eukprot:TRINITY_DN30075_c0_g1_i1.p1 TRINITY_DN30075_c0_g1~~TRINITY_DN30075_c0_g1_i1.p1  ORF type:complete len:680 (+),score=214.40 TRINITY_DN30075_c0_g1_i1:41-2080(+)
MEGPEWENYAHQNIIGRGAQGCAYLCRSKQTQEEVVVKTVFIRDKSNEEIEKAMLEVSILSNLRNDNIVQYIDYFIDGEGMLCMVMEYAAGGDLASVVKEHSYDKTVPPDDIVVDVGRQMLCALKYLRTMRVMHRDIKPANILIGQDGLLKLSDFGVARLLELDQAGAQTFTGTPFYISPELCLGEPYGFGADVWALGVTLYELASLTHPFKGTNLLAIVNSITDGVYEPMQHRSPLVVDLVAELLTADPTERKTATQLLGLFFPTDTATPVLNFSSASFNKSIPAVQTEGSTMFSPSKAGAAAAAAAFSTHSTPEEHLTRLKPHRSPQRSPKHDALASSRHGSVVSDYSDPGLHEYLTTVQKAQVDGQATIFGGEGKAEPAADPAVEDDYEDDFYEYEPSAAPNLQWMNNMRDGNLEHKIRAKAEALQKKRLIIYEKRKKQRAQVSCLNPSHLAEGSPHDNTTSTISAPITTVSPPARVKARFLGAVSMRTAKEKGVSIKPSGRAASSSPNYDSDSGSGSDHKAVLGGFNTTSGKDALKSVKRLMEETMRTRAELGIDSESSSTTGEEVEEREEAEEGAESDSSSSLDADLVQVCLCHTTAEGKERLRRVKNLPEGGELKKLCCEVADWLPGCDADAHLYWVDSDGDKVRIMTQEDMDHAVEAFWQGSAAVLDVSVIL